MRERAIAKGGEGNRIAWLVRLTQCAGATCTRRCVPSPWTMKHNFPPKHYQSYTRVHGVNLRRLQSWYLLIPQFWISNKSLRQGPFAEADSCFAYIQLVHNIKSTWTRHHTVCWSCLIFSDPLRKKQTPCSMPILSDLIWCITQESDTTLCADPIWSCLIHYTRIRHHAVCWSCLIFSDQLHKNPTPRCMLILSDLVWSITQESDTTLYADAVWSFLINYTRIRHHAVCWSYLIFSDPVRTLLSYIFDIHLATFSHISAAPPSNTFFQIFLSKIRMHFSSMRASCPDSHVSCFDNPIEIIKPHTVHRTAASCTRSGRPALRHS